MNIFRFIKALFFVGIIGIIVLLWHTDAKIQARRNMINKIDSQATYFQDIKIPQITSKPTVAQYNKPLIDCIGPDGKHLKITREECDEFNAAWSNNPTPIQDSITSVVTPISNLQNQTHSFSVQCQTKYGIYIEYGTSSSQAQGFCDSLNESLNKVETIITHIPSPPSTNNAELMFQCTISARNDYNFALSACSSHNSISSYSCGTTAQSAYDQAMSNCHSKYGD